MIWVGMREIYFGDLYTMLPLIKNSRWIANLGQNAIKPSLNKLVYNRFAPPQLRKLKQNK